MATPYRSPVRGPLKGHEFSRALRRGPVVWPGGYTLRLFMEDGGILCFDCARTEAVSIRLAAMRRNGAHDWRPYGFDVMWEGPDECCDECGCVMPTEYGDPKDS